MWLLLLLRREVIIEQSSGLTQVLHRVRWRVRATREVLLSLQLQTCRRCALATGVPTASCMSRQRLSVVERALLYITAHAKVRPSAGDARGIVDSLVLHRVELSKALRGLTCASECTQAKRA